MAFSSLLAQHETGVPGRPELSDDASVRDLHLDQIVAAVTAGREEPDLLASLLYGHIGDIDTLQYRQEIFTDLEAPVLLEAAGHFAGQLRQVRRQLDQIAEMISGGQRQAWFLDAAATYCEAVRGLADALASGPVSSRGLRAFREYLSGYAAAPEFGALAADTAECRGQLARITYLVRIRGPRVEVSRYDGEPDYSAEITQTFERFRQGAVKDYRITYRGWPGMTYVGAQILALVARLFPAEFTTLANFCGRHSGFLDPAVRQFERELQFYLAYLDYIAPLRAAGLSFCYPELSTSSKEVFASDTFDLSLAARLVPRGDAVITNDFRLSGAERSFVVSGPNQGGKTTFARTFGQLHHLAGVGCPVPGSAARLQVFDQLFTHFEREEDIGNLAGKLEDDLIRIQKVLQGATADSIVIMNEIFTSTTLNDARFLGGKVMAKIIDLGVLCVYVTFVDELASADPSVVSMASTIVADNPAERTYKVVRKPADGLAYALALADKNRVTYEQLKGRIRP
jgi:hypothetical protein